MWSVKYRPNPGSASISARSAPGRPATSSTTSGTPSVNIREEVRLSASVSGMAPTCECDGPAPGTGPMPSHSSRRSLDVLLTGVRSGGLQHLVGPEEVRRRGGRREGVATSLACPVEVLTGLPRLVGLLAGPAGVDEVLVGALQWAEQLEPLEAGGLLDGAGATAEALLEAVLLLRRHGHGVDLHDTHAGAVPAGRVGQSRRWGTLVA